MLPYAIGWDELGYTLGCPVGWCRLPWLIAVRVVYDARRTVAVQTHGGRAASNFAENKQAGKGQGC